MEEALKNLPKEWVLSPGKNLISLKDARKIGSVADLMTPLYTWAKKYQVGIEPNGVGYFESHDRDGELWTSFIIRPDFAITEKFFGDGTSSDKTGKVSANGTWRCLSCYRYGLAVQPITRIDGGILLLCSVCTDNCDNCQKPIYAHEYGPQDPHFCAECRPVFRCPTCNLNRAKEGSILADIYNASGRIGKAGATICAACATNRLCGECSHIIVRGIKLVDYEGIKCCPHCHEEKVQKDFEKFEKFRIEELPKGGLTIKSLPARPFRTISIETEVDGNKHMLAKTLYNCGLVRVPEVERYGTATPDQSKWAAFLKHDGSVTGGELISFMLNLDNKEHTEAFKVILRKLRALDKAKLIEFNPNCGGHIHIDAHGFGTENIWRLLTVWNYLEDFTYRLAGSGHEYGHRTLVPGHDRANGGAGYANPTVKGPWGVRSSVGEAVRMQNRMCGLNFQPYIGASRYCECGAFHADNGRACKCALPKCTIEWRVWNSQRSPRILHAWIAYMQAVHAYADVPEEPTAAFERGLPTLAWTRKPWDKLSKAQKGDVFTRMEWIFGNLVFTPEERDSLIYAIKQSDIVITPTEEKQLRSIRAASEVAPRKTLRWTKFNARQHRIVIAAPKPGDNPLEERLTMAQAFDGMPRQRVRPFRPRIR
jgi:hypothetical protein